MRLLPVTYALAVLLGFTFFFSPVQAQETQSLHDHHMVNVTAEDYAFQAPDEIPAGWTTIEYVNEGEEPHFLVMGRLPHGKTLDDYASDVYPPLNGIWYDLRDKGIGHGEAMKRFSVDLPEWFWAIEFMGGSGLLEPGLSSKVTVDLKPGTFFMECYMQTEDGEFHAMEGMVREFTVTDTRSNMAPPEANIDITLSNFEMVIDGEVTPGSHTVAVHVTEQPEEGFAHNLHIARLSSEMDVEEIVRWMNFMEVDGLRSPAPTEFIGGMYVRSDRQTGYFTVDLKPGRYLFVSQHTGHRGVLKEVRVEP